MTVIIRPAKQEDADRWLEMRQALWSTANPAELKTEVEKFLHNAKHCCLVAEDPANKQLAGFVETSLRSIADGCDSSPVGYIEGLYVVPESRNQGTAKLLMQAAEEWSRANACTEMASDAEIENQASIDMHQKLGFEEVSRVITLRKAL